MTLQIGSLLYNRYRIQQVIAQGGMGAIYRANDESLGVQVAVKENLFATEESIRQFRREATILAGLRHPNLPRVTDHFSIDAQGQYLVMDFIEGDDLRQRLSARGPASEDEAIAIGAAVCDALQYLHTRQPPVVHRDIKLGNIKITPTGQVFLVDFGLAKVVAPGMATTTGAQALTPGYASPEQYGQGTTPLSDIYSLGATLYATLTNKIPEDGLARAMESTRLTPLRAYAPSVSERTALVIEKAMSVRPEERYASAEALRLALLNTTPAAARRSSQPLPFNSQETQAAASSATVRMGGGMPQPPTHQFPTVATPQGGFSQASPQPVPAVEKKAGFPYWILGAILVLIILIGGAFLVLRGSGGLFAPPATPTSTITLTLTIAPTAIPTTAVPPTATPQPSATAAPTATSTIKPTALPSPSLTPTPAPPTSTSTPAPTATPAATPLGGGGGMIAFASLREGKRPQIWVANPDGSGQRALTDVVDGACQPAWSPDGKRLVFVTPCIRQMEEYPGGTLVVINADGSASESLPTLPGGDFDPAWSPDGTLIAFTSLREGTAHIFTITLATRKVDRVTGAFSDDRRPAWSPDGKKIAFESTRLGQKQVWTMGAKGENQAEFTRMAEGPAFRPAWSGDGSILIYNRDNALPWVYARRTDQTLPPESRLTETRPVFKPVFSKDGNWIAYEGWTGSNHDIYIMRNTGTSRQAVTNDANFDFDAAWRP